MTLSRFLEQMYGTLSGGGGYHIWNRSLLVKARGISLNGSIVLWRNRQDCFCIWNAVRKLCEQLLYQVATEVGKRLS